MRPEGRLGTLWTVGAATPKDGVIAPSVGGGGVEIVYPEGGEEFWPWHMVRSVEWRDE
jgi:hypothetical protein